MPKILFIIWLVSVICGFSPTACANITFSEFYTLTEVVLSEKERLNGVERSYKLSRGYRGSGLCGNIPYASIDRLLAGGGYLTIGVFAEASDVDNPFGNISMGNQWEQSIEVSVNCAHSAMSMYYDNIHTAVSNGDALQGASGAASWQDLFFTEALMDLINRIAGSRLENSGAFAQSDGNISDNTHGFQFRYRTRAENSVETGFRDVEGDSGNHVATPGHNSGQERPLESDDSDNDTSSWSCFMGCTCKFDPKSSRKDAH